MAESEVQGKGGPPPTPTYFSLPLSFQYSSSLNCIISVSGASGIEVLDIHSGKITTRASLHNEDGSTASVHGLCKFLDDEDKVVVASGNRVGLRSTNGEQIFLNTILQVSDIPQDGEVTVELDIVKAGLLLNGLERCLKTTDPFSSTPGVVSSAQKSQFQQVTMTLKNAYEKAVVKMKDVSGRGIKWLTVCLTMEHDILTTVFNTALLLCKQDKRGPALPVIGDILQRLTSMQKTMFESMSSEKRLMFNEVDRLQTFNSWPHMNYKWALPGPMAEAGFYHPHSSSKSAEDRAMCFTCSVCLVSWESSDQPWSEHKRHSPNCPFVKGEYTENVPLQVFTATAGAQQLTRSTDKITCISSTSCDYLIATGTEEGYIVIWETFPSLKVHSEYQISVSAIKDSRKKSRSSKSKKTALKLPDSLKTIASEVANDVIKESNNVQAESKTNELPDCVKADDEEIKSDTKVAQDSMTEVIFEGESYCVIAEPMNHNRTDEESSNSNVFSIEDSILEADDSVITSPMKDNDREETENVMPTTEKKLKNSSESKNKSKSVEPSCCITCVTIMKNEENNVFIVAGVKIESKKVRKNKERHKHKLSLLVYKLAGKKKVKKVEISSEPVNPLSGNPFLPMMVGSVYEDDFSMGSDDDYCMFEDSIPTQLSVIDEYLLAAQKNPSAGNGGTQNIGPNGNEIKTGFDQEEIVKIDDIKTVYEDCAFHKFDIDRSFYTKGMYVSNLLVVDGYLVTILKRYQQPEGMMSSDTDEEEKNCLLIGSITMNKKRVIDLKLVAQSVYTGENLIKDIVSVPCHKLPPNLLTNLAALNQFENMDNSPNHAAGVPQSLVVLGLADNSFMFLSVPQLTELKIPSNIPDDRSIHKIAYCTALSSLAICDDKGYFTVCSCSRNQENPFEMSLNDLSITTENQWESRFLHPQLKLLTELTKFEPVTQGCYIFFPVNWYVTRSGGTKSMKMPVPSHLLKLSPVEMDKRLMKRTEQLDIELSKSDFTFRVFVLVQTSVGYFDIMVDLKTSLKESEDFSCSFYIDESRSNGVSCDNNAKNTERLLCGPMLFSDVMDSSRLWGKFTVIIPELLNHKNVYIIVKLEHAVQNGKSNATSEEKRKNQATSPTDFLISDILKDVYVGVYQFKPLIPNTFYFPGCRNVLMRDAGFQENLLDQFLQLADKDGDMRPGFEMHLILDLLTWITSMHLSSSQKDSCPLVAIMQSKLSKFLRACLLYGNRSICHRCGQMLLGLKRCVKDNSFAKEISEQLWKLLPNIHNAFSPAACHWAFWLLCDCIYAEMDLQESLQKFTLLLLKVGEAYGNRFTEIQKILDARYGLSEMIFEPIMVEPLFMKLRCGTAVTPNGTKGFEMVQISTEHLPGILEAQPLHFVCISASEGSKVEQLKSKTVIAKIAKGATQLGGSFPIISQQEPLSIAQQFENDEKKNFETDTLSDLFDLVQQQQQPFHESMGVPLSIPNISSTLPISKKTMAAKPASVAQIEETSADGEAVIPKPMCMIVDKMHVYSIHHVVLDFKSTVLLSDITFPPCKSLASVAIYAWAAGQTADSAKVVAFSHMIGQKALVLSNIVPPISLQYIKIIVEGSDSCSLVIPLGQYYGHAEREINSPHTTKDKYQRQYEDIFCRYSLTADRIKPFPMRIESSTKYSKGVNTVLTAMKKDYALCSHLQLCLNFLRKNLALDGSSSLKMEGNLSVDLSKLPKLEEQSFSSQQLVLHCLLKCIAYYFSSSGKAQKTLQVSSANSDMLSREEFLSLFKSICTYGAGSITETATSVLYLISGKSSWWCDALVDIFEYCFGTQTVPALPRRRLFNVLIKLINITEDTNTVVEKFLNLLLEKLKTMSSSNTSNSTNLSMLDWALLVLSKILEDIDVDLWKFFSPWDHLPDPAANNINNAACSMHSVPLSEAGMAQGKTEKSSKLVHSKLWYPEKQTKKLSPTNTKDGMNVSVTSEDGAQSSEKKSGVNMYQKVFISKGTAIPVLKSLLDFIISKVCIGNPEQLILCCKVCSLILTSCQNFICLEDLLETEELKELIMPCFLPNCNKWLLLAINKLLKSFVEQMNVFKSKLTSELKPLEHDARKPTKSTTLSGPPVSTKDLPGATPKLDHLKKMHEAIMTKKFFEAAELAKPFMEKITETSATEKEIESSLSAKECEVTHYIQNTFETSTESLVYNLQKQFREVKLLPFSKSQQEQCLNIEDSVSFVKKIVSMQSSSLSYLFTILLNVFEKHDEHIGAVELQQILFLLNMLKQNKLVIDNNLEARIGNNVINVSKLTALQDDVAVRSIAKQLVELLLTMPESASFSMQLLQFEVNGMQIKGSYQLHELTLMSLKQLISKECLVDEERMMLKQLLLNHISYRKPSDDTSMLDVLKLVIKMDVFLKWNTDEEVKLTSKMIVAMSRKIINFINDSAVHLQASQQERSDTKRTVFVLHNGNVRLAGKTHVLEHDVNECVVMLEVLKIIFTSNIFENREESLMQETFANLLECLCKSGDLTNKLSKTFTPLLEVPGELLSANLHPLAMSVLHILIEIGKQKFWPCLVDALVHVFAEESKKKNSTMSADDIKILMKILLGKSADIWSYFVEKGGFDTLCQVLISHSHANINWTDNMKHSPTIQDLYLPNISSSKKMYDKDRVKKDHDGVILENFAPYAKITGPVTSPAPDVLLMNKSPLRRSRFAAWAHQFQETDNPWIELNIIFPFEIMLREVVIYMHTNYLVGAPSEVIVQVKGISNSYATLSPSLQTGGLQSIVLHFAEGQIAKELRFWLHRPNGADHIKLNLIELHGRSIFASNENESLVPNHRKFQFETWVELLALLFTEIPAALQDFSKYPDLYKVLTALITMMPFLSRLCLHRLSSAFVTNLLQTIPDFALFTTKDITDRMLSLSYLHRLDTMQLQLMIQLLADMIVKTSSDEQTRIFSYLLDWMPKFLCYMKDGTHTVISEALHFIIRKVFKLIKTLDLDRQQLTVSDELVSIIDDLLLRRTLRQNVYGSIFQFLNILVLLKPSMFVSHLSRAKASLKLLTDVDETIEREKISPLLSIVYCFNKLNENISKECFEYFDDFSALFCDILQNVNDTHDNITEHTLKVISSMVTILYNFIYSKNDISSWFSTAYGRMFWKPLLKFICRNEGTRCDALIMYSLQNNVIMLFQDILYLNPCNQDYFSALLIELLTENKEKRRGLNGYMKLILLHLVITEDTIIVQFKSKCDMYILQNTHQLHLRITATLGEIEQTLLKIRGTVYGSNSKGEKTAKSGESTPPHLHPDPSSNYMMQAASFAAAKRRPKQKADNKSTANNSPSTKIAIDFFLTDLSDQPLPKNLQFGQVLQLLYEKDPQLLRKPPLLQYGISNGSTRTTEDESSKCFLDSPSLCTMLETFAHRGGLPFLTPQSSDQRLSTTSSYITLFSMILPLPGFSTVFLKDRIKAEILLRLMLGVKETKAGQHIHSLTICQDLPVLPLMSLKNLLQESSSQTEDGIELRRLAFKQDIISFVMAHLKQLSHYKEKDEKKLNKGLTSGAGLTDTTYWAKGTGFGTGSTVSSWDIEKAMKEKKKEEEQIVVILHVLAAFIGTSEITEVRHDVPLMNDFEEILKNSCVVSVLAGYLHNDSVLDMSRHIPLYHAVLSLLRSLASVDVFIPLLTSMKGQQVVDKANTLFKLLTNLKSCVDTYQNRLRTSSKSKGIYLGERSKQGKTSHRSRLMVSKDEVKENDKEAEEADVEELNILLCEIHSSAEYVQMMVDQYLRSLNATLLFESDVWNEDLVCSSGEKESEEVGYVNEMIQLQFDTYEIVNEKDDGTLQFNVSYHYATSVLAAAKNADVGTAARARRLAQEVASLSSSLPISYSSTVFLQCDEERLDVMKVLITGPVDTPYENGCFEFDVYFPQDYPSSPMCVNLQTTGKHTVRFNPNLYNDGKVCLSILNTWHGRPEERWNAQTSNLLQVLVSIQSLILVTDPYFNEPGYERLRGTPQGKQNCNDYNANIKQATVKWAVLEQLKRPSPCFKEIIHKHFLRKKSKVIAQCELWLKELKEQASKRKSTIHSYESLKAHFAELKLELMKLEKKHGQTLSAEQNGKLAQPAQQEKLSDEGGENSETTSEDPKKTDEKTMDTGVVYL